MYQSYKRVLIKQQQQAYQGAKMFYFGFLPSTFLGLIFYTLYLYQQISNTIQIPTNQTKNRNEIIKQQKTIIQFKSISLYISLTIILYFVAAYYYIKCNKIQTYPGIVKNKLLDEDRQMEQLQIQTQNCIDDINNSNSNNNNNNNNNNNSSIQSISNNNNNSLNNNINNNMNNNRPQKYFCSYCNFLCQYRTKHCSKCQTCIQRYDHHCFWIGNCVGKHNHKFFYLFLLSQTILNTFQLFSLLQLQSITYFSLIPTHIIIWTCIYSLILLTFGFIIFTGWLLIYHSMLIFIASTTWEQMRRQKINYLKYLPIGYNPFSKGYKKNIKTFFTQETRDNNDKIQVQIWDNDVINYDQVKNIQVGFNIIQNQYYSCC